MILFYGAHKCSLCDKHDDTTQLSSNLNPDDLPLSIQKFRWVQDLEAYCSDRVVEAYAILFKYDQFLRNSPGYDSSKNTHELAISVRRRLNNPLDMALAEICSGYIEEYINNNHDQNYSAAYIKLVEALCR